LILYTFVVLGSDASLATLVTWTQVTGIGQAILGLIVTGAVTYGTVQEMRGYHVPLGDSISVGLKRSLPVLWVGLLAGLCIMGGLILLIIPGLMLMCALWVVVPVAVVERPGGVDALKRSAELTGGFRWSILGIFLLVGILNAVVGNIAQRVLIEVSLSVLLIGSLIIGFVFNIYGAVCAAVGYSILRNEKDGVELDELAAVFE
jgi:hypothetical protein